MVRLALVLLLGRSRVLRVFSWAALGLVGGACIWVFRSVRVEAIGSHADSLAIQTPVKAHLRDGSTVLYRGGGLLAAAVAAFVIVCSSRDCWGNCPTVYADSAGASALQAEGFSYTFGPT